MSPIIIGIILWALALVFHQLLRIAINLAKDFEDRDGKDTRYSRISVKLNIYEAILKTIGWTLTPFIAVVIGTIMPDQIRKLLQEYIGTSTLIAACLAAIFAYMSIFLLLKNNCWNSGLKKTLLDYFRTKKV